jgi:hypothetical protein
MELQLFTWFLSSWELFRRTVWALKHTVPPQNGDFCTVSEVGPVTTNATFSPFDKNNLYWMDIYGVENIVFEH